MPLVLDQGLRRNAKDDPEWQIFWGVRVDLPGFLLDKV